MAKHDNDLFDQSPATFVRTVESVKKKLDDLVLHHHLSHWHPITTAPCNQNLELSVMDDNKIIALPFPCRRTNNGDWINVDLGIRARIEPVRWRLWQRSGLADKQQTQPTAP